MGFCVCVSECLVCLCLCLCLGELYVHTHTLSLYPVLTILIAFSPSFPPALVVVPSLRVRTVASQNVEGVLAAGEGLRRGEALRGGISFAHGPLTALLLPEGRAAGRWPVLRGLVRQALRCWCMRCV